MKILELNKKQILEYQQNRDPYLMIDHASKVVPGKSAEGYKFLSKDQWFLKFTGLMTQICQVCFKLRL